ncbi:MAG: hypothetical protein EKK64_03565 [Neisseriaceae bacterium]|nr:MAG: hypothetical protein EKK64_03565 [Neisseriaceae bacterium]
MPNCKEKACNFVKNDSIFLGVNLENIAIWTCRKHSTEEIENYLKEIGEREASALQSGANPFSDVRNLCREKATII